MLRAISSYSRTARKKGSEHLRWNWRDVHRGCVTSECRILNIVCDRNKRLFSYNKITSTCIYIVLAHNLICNNSRIHKHTHIYIYVFESTNDYSYYFHSLEQRVFLDADIHWFNKNNLQMMICNCFLTLLYHRRIKIVPHKGLIASQNVKN